MWAHYFGSTDSTRRQRDSLTARYGVEDPADARQDDFSRVRQPALSICAAQRLRTSTRGSHLTPLGGSWRAHTTSVCSFRSSAESVRRSRTRPRAVEPLDSAAGTTSLSLGSTTFCVSYGLSPTVHRNDSEDGELLRSECTPGAMTSTTDGQVRQTYIGALCKRQAMV